MTKPTLLAALTLLLASALPLAAQDVPPDVLDTAYVPGAYRVFTGAGTPASLDDIVAAMARHQVVFVGETHDDPTGHMLEATLLERAYAAYSAERPVVLSLEFFERDVQLVMDEYLAGLISERMFLKDSRPSTRYESDYRPLIEFAKERGLAVLAANAPRRYVSRVATHGREALDGLSAGAREYLPPLPYGQPSDAYRRQWIQEISELMEQEGTKCGVPLPALEGGQDTVTAQASMSPHGSMGNQMHSQVLWDATMAHSIARALSAEPRTLVLHVVGGFHVQYGTGTPEHLAAYRPGTSFLIVLMRPVESVDTFEPAPEGAWGDYVIQTDQTRTLEAIECREYLAGRE